MGGSDEDARCGGHRGVPVTGDFVRREAVHPDTRRAATFVTAPSPWGHPGTSRANPLVPGEGYTLVYVPVASSIGGLLSDVMSWPVREPAEAHPEGFIPPDARLGSVMASPR